MDSLPIFSGGYSLRNRSCLPNSPGIYFVSDQQNQILYIGQAKNLRSRWGGRNHHRYKQLARKGLDKIYLYYIEVAITELDSLEKLYINQFKPILNDSKVKEYLPKKSPKYSDLQRLLKVANTAHLPNCKFEIRNGITVPRKDWDMIRGFIAGIDETQDIPHILVICQQNMGNLLWNRVLHKTKKRFCSYDKENRCFRVNLRSVIFVFAELFSREFCEPIFEATYPYLVDCNQFGVTGKKLTNLTVLSKVLSEVPNSILDTELTRKAYLIKTISHLKLLPNDFKIDPQKTW
ncbi:MAG: GIY-YIG nuclease family protein [Microcoleaceae cyanobacterium]